MRAEKYVPAKKKLLAFRYRLQSFELTVLCNFLRFAEKRAFELTIPAETSDARQDRHVLLLVRHRSSLCSPQPVGQHPRSRGTHLLRNGRGRMSFRKYQLPC